MFSFPPLYGQKLNDRILNAADWFPVIALLPFIEESK